MKPKKTIHIWLFLFVPMVIFGQKGIINQGAIIQIQEGFSVVMESDMSLINQNDGGIELDGSVYLKDDIINNGTSNLFINPDNTGFVYFVGSVDQLIGGSQPLYLDNMIVASDVNLENNVFQEGDLTLAGGKITLNDYNYQLLDGSDISGEFSESNMIVINGFGEFRRGIGQQGLYAFPIGTNNGTPDYSPISLAVNEISVVEGSYIGAYVVNQKYSYNYSAADYLQRYWTFSTEGLNSITFDAAFNYVDSDVIGQESSIYGTVYVGDAPTFYNTVNSVSNTFEVSNQQSFGVFTGSDGATDIINESFNGLKLYPNPTTGIIYIAFEQFSNEKVIIELYNQQGTIVDYDLNYEKTNSTNELIRYNFGDLSPGLYVLKLISKDKRMYKKFILE